MKNLVIASLMVGLASCVGTSFANATEFCPAGNVTGEVRIVLDDEDGPSHSIEEGCITSADTDIIIDASMPLGTSETNTSTVSIGPNVNIGARSVVSVLGVSSNFVDTRAPIVVNIVGNTFGEDAIVFLNGAFSRGSTINIAGNSFNANAPLFDRMPSALGSVSTWTAAITVNELYLQSSVVSITGNDIRGSARRGSDTTVMGINIDANLFFVDDGAKFTVSRNNITTSCSPSADGAVCSIGVRCLTAYGYAQGAYNVDNNRFAITGGLATAMPDVVNPMTSSSYSFTGNYGTVNTVGLSRTIPFAQPFMTIGNLNLKEFSSVLIADNDFAVNGAHGMIVLLGDCLLADNNTLIFRNNVIKTTGCDPGIYFTHFSVMGETKIDFETNTFVRDDATPVSRPMIFMGGSYALKQNSKMMVASNTFGGRTPSTASTAILLDLSSTAAGSGFVFEQTASLRVCTNVVDNVAIVASSQTRAEIASVLGNRAFIGGCGIAPATVATVITTKAPITTTVPISTTTSTTAPATTVFQQNGAPAIRSTVLAAAAIVALFASLAALL